jgi:hypothetical protein
MKKLKRAAIAGFLIFGSIACLASYYILKLNYEKSYARKENICR